MSVKVLKEFSNGGSSSNQRIIDIKSSKHNILY